MSIERIREALAAGPTPGEWACYDDSSDGKTNRIEIAAIGKTVARIYRSVQEQDLPNARLIAACSPANMTAILAHVDAQEVALVAAEAALADIGDADREPGDDIKWAERRAMQALPIVRNALACRCDMRTWDRAQQALAEIERLTAALQWEQSRAERLGTHGPGCADWGPSHYECAIRERDELRRQLAEAEPPQVFTRWVRDNMPPNTVISDPDWWAARLWRAAMRAHGIGGSDAE